MHLQLQEKTPGIKENLMVITKKILVRKERETRKTFLPMTERVEELWSKYQIAYAVHNESSDNIEELQSIIDSGDYASFVDELGVGSTSNPHAAVKKRVSESSSKRMMTR